MSAKVNRVLEVPKDTNMNCLVWNKKNGYLAYLAWDEQNVLKAKKLIPTWELKYPCPSTYCSGGDKDKDSRCLVPVPSSEHPHIIMINSEEYGLDLTA